MPDAKIRKDLVKADVNALPGREEPSNSTKNKKKKGDKHG